jgi:hypothetical protein
MRIISQKGQVDFSGFVPGPVSASGEFLLMNWTEALDSYRYPVNFPKRFSNGFGRNLQKGNRKETMEFEAYFRKAASRSMTPWHEVIYWKMFSQGGRGRKKASDMIKYLKASHVKANDLWQRCNNYAQSFEEGDAEKTKKLFAHFVQAFVKHGSIATVATFPAFLKPESFPMVDSQVANWVRDWCKTVNARHDGPKLFPPNQKDNLTMSDFRFMESWTKWCRFKAKKLHWRARDVEMAIFTVQRVGSLIINQKFKHSK